MKRSFLAALCIFAALFVLSGCTSRHSLELPLPSSAPEIMGPQRTAILSSLRQSYAPSSFRSLIETQIESHGQKEQLRQAVTFERPNSSEGDRLRVEAFASGLNQLLFLAVVQDARLSAIVPQDHQLLFGAANRKAVEYLLSVPLSADELMAWLTGAVLPPFQHMDQARVVDLGKGRYLVQTIDREGRMLRVSGNVSMLPRFDEFSLSISGDGALKGSYEYGPEALPRRITFTLPEASGTLDITRAEINPDLSAVRAQLFQIPEPKGYSRIEIGQ